MDEHPALPRDPFPRQLVARCGLTRLPREGGWYRRTWAGPERPDGRPEGSAIVVLLTAEPGVFSALHRLPSDETWHFYRGDPLILFLLPGDDATGHDDGAGHADGGAGTRHDGGHADAHREDEAEGTGAGGPGRTARTVVLGPDVLAGQYVQFTVPAGTWMAAEVADGGAWTLFGCTMAPGFTFADYEHGDAGRLAARFPREAARIGELSRA
ncbi:cupin domain-containing protein [Streptomyces sp. RS10V-4]|uniref:cupin domain-containing protein n=1 Tax=Streptomyces rhizoryzae TaxID=2932493 RepID=UPI00200653A6|nr:cupin domain-containing protein [Streptomyces rhizoryzae]MCK7623603.1 cupin domain-containing protein [Streptomyces rhizoryzae]